MCYTDNSAIHTSAFLNAQLSCLWENSAACAKKLDLGQQTTANRYATALAKYSFVRPRFSASLAPDFDATFNKPSLRFVCNHDAILHLCIAECRYAVSSPQNGRSTPVPGKSGKIKELKDVEVEFRIPFQLSAIQGGMSMIGTSHDNIKLLSLNFSDPQLYSISPSVVEADREAITLNLKGYLRFLQRAGRHILFCLPEFDDAGLRYIVDFSSAVETFVSVATVFDIPIQKINDFLSASWLNAVILSGTSGNPSSTGTGLALAQYLSTWSSRDPGIHFNISFSAPTIKALCAQEVLVTFNIQSVSFYEGRSLESDTLLQTFTDWKFSFLSTVEREQSEGGGSMIRFVLDQSEYHYMEHLSEFPGYDGAGDIHGLKNRLKEFFVAEYLIRIERDELHILYDSDVVFVLPGAESPDEFDEPEVDYDSDGEAEVGKGGPPSPKTTIRREISVTSDVGIFDVISAISQAAVNLHFRSCWEYSLTRQTTWSSIMTKWTHSEVFEAEFKPITARLLSNERALIVITMDTGHLNVGENGFDKDAALYEFSHWRLAFEVPLVKCRHGDIPGVDASWTSRFQETLLFKEHGRAADCEFCHIYANFEDAEFVPTFSHFDGLFSGNVQRDSMFKVNALLTLMREQYLPLLMTAGYHVVHTIPVWKGGDPPIGAFTDFHFRVVSETVVTRKTLKGRSRCNDPIIVILGVGPPKSLPKLRLDLPFAWLVRMARQMRSGSVILSHNLFLKPKFLMECSAVNALTTPVPFFTRLDGPNWDLRLELWAKNVDHKHMPSDFDLESPVEGELHYGWQHEARTHEQLGPSSSPLQKYTASCYTTNRLIIPTTYAHGLLDIQIKGRVELRIWYGIDPSEPPTARAAVNWVSNLYVKTYQGCLYVDVVSAQPRFEEPIGKSPNGGCDPRALLREHFGKAPDLARVNTLFQRFEEPWKSSYPGEGAFNLTHPSFNKNGDLLFELRPFVKRGAGCPTFLPKPQRLLTPKQPSGPLDPLGIRGRSERQASPELQVAPPERPLTQTRPRADYSGSRSRNPINGRASPAQPALGSQSYLHDSEEYVFHGNSNLRVPGAAFPTSVHRSRGNTPVHSRPASPRQAHFVTEPDTTMLKQSLFPRENSAGGFAFSARSGQVVNTQPIYYITPPTDYVFEG